MIEVVVEGFFSALGEILAYSLWPILYYSGWLFLKGVTIGGYPPAENKMMFGTRKHSRAFVRFIGFLVCVIISYYIYVLFIR